METLRIPTLAVRQKIKSNKFHNHRRQNFALSHNHFIYKVHIFRSDFTSPSVVKVRSHFLLTHAIRITSLHNESHHNGYIKIGQGLIINRSYVELGVFQHLPVLLNVVLLLLNKLDRVSHKIPIVSGIDRKFRTKVKIIPRSHFKRLNTLS